MGPLSPAQLTLGGLTAGRQATPLPGAAPTINAEGDQLQARWGSDLGEARRGVFYCSGSDQGNKVITLKTYKEGKLDDEVKQVEKGSS